MKPKITIITPSYNQGIFIEKTIQSILDQEYSNFEYIIIDGGSTDNSSDIIRKYEDVITYWISEKDKGQSNAINKGLKYGSGDIINWLNSDDYLEHNALQKVAHAFENNLNVDIVCGYSRLRYKDRNVLKRSSKYESNMPRTIVFGQIMQPSTFFKKEVFDSLTPVEESLHFMMDHYIWLQYIVSNGFSKVLFLDDIFANVTMHEKAKSVCQIEDFRYEKIWIYYSLFFSMRKQLKFPMLKKIVKNKNQPLSFININKSIFNITNKLNFYLLYEDMWVRDKRGSKRYIRFITFLYLLIYFRKSLISEIASHFKIRI